MSKWPLGYIPPAIEGGEIRGCGCVFAPNGDVYVCPTHGVRPLVEEKSKMMDEGEFREFCVELYAEANDVRHKAGEEYASQNNVFDNFARLAASLKRRPNLRKITQGDVLLIYLQKHIDSIMSGVSLRESIRGRVIDAINYLSLLAAMQD